MIVFNSIYVTYLTCTTALKENKENVLLCLHLYLNAPFCDLRFRNRELISLFRVIFYDGYLFSRDITIMKVTNYEKNWPINFTLKKKHNSNYTEIWKYWLIRLTKILILFGFKQYYFSFGSWFRIITCIIIEALR